MTFGRKVAFVALDLDCEFSNLNDIWNHLTLGFPVSPSCWVSRRALIRVWHSRASLATRGGISLEIRPCHFEANNPSCCSHRLSGALAVGGEARVSIYGEPLDARNTRKESRCPPSENCQKPGSDWNARSSSRPKPAIFVSSQAKVVVWRAQSLELERPRWTPRGVAARVASALQALLIRAYRTSAQQRLGRKTDRWLFENQFC